MNKIVIFLACLFLFSSTIGIIIKKWIFASYNLNHIFSCSGVPSRFGGFSWPRLPLDVLLKGQRPQYNEQDNSKIIGGEIVEPNSLPFQVSLQLRSNGVHYCGGIVSFIVI